MPKARPPQWSSWTWRWISVIESLGPEYASRLTRARSYARNGHVWRLDIHPGKLSAQVLGSYGYYSTSVRIPTLPDTLWQEVAAWLVESPLLLANLLSGELSPELDILFERAGAPLFPTSVEDFSWSCTCPDWEKPCKHALTLCYTFAERLNGEPGLLLALRGKTIEELSAMAQWLWTNRETAEDEDTAENGDDAGAAGVPGEAPDLTAFYQAGPGLEEFAISPRAPGDAVALLYRIGKPPFAAEHEDPLTPLAHVYTAMTEQALNTLERVWRAEETRRKR